jgi:protein-disulfide isomerase
MSHRRLIIIATVLAVLASLFALPNSGARAQSDGLDIEAILNDPDAPVAGNPQGDVTIVAFLDYNCPFCKKTAADLQRFVATDGKVRLVYKDWPILTKASVYGARLALAAKYQGKYDVVHAALMRIRGRGTSEESMLAAVKSSGVDMNALQNDLDAHAADIAAILKRNMGQANALGLQGTPVYLIGPFKIASALDYNGFEKAVSEFRARIAK